MAKRAANVVMRITKTRKNIIKELTSALSELAPSTAYGGSFSVKKVAHDMGLDNCWKKQRNKKEDIYFLLENTMRYYQRKPSILVLNIIEGGVVWCSKKGLKVTSEQIENIIFLMDKLGFNIKKKALEIDIPAPSNVRPPAKDKIALMHRFPLHEALKHDVLQLFFDGHLNESIRKGLERFEKYVQDNSNTAEIGSKLMGIAFGVQNPQIPINNMTEPNDKSEQEGFMFLTKGAMSGMRNIYSHGDVSQMSCDDAIERLFFISLLFKRVEKALGK